MKKPIIKTYLITLLLGVASISAAPSFTPTGIPKPTANYTAVEKSAIFNGKPATIVLDTIKTPQNSTYYLKDAAGGLPEATFTYNQAGSSLVAKRGSHPISLWSSKASNPLIFAPSSATFPTINMNTHKKVTNDVWISGGISFQAQQTLAGQTYSGFAELDIVALMQYLKKFNLVWAADLGYAWPLTAASKAAIYKATYEKIRYIGGEITVHIGKTRPNGWPIMLYLNISIDPQTDSMITIDSISLVLVDQPNKGPIVTISGDELKQAGIVQSGQGKNPYMPTQSGS